MSLTTARPAVSSGIPIAATLRGWRYAGGKRDVRLDFLRGFSAFAMVVDHIGGRQSLLYPLTGGNRFYTGAAEAFVFISGLVMGIVYRDLIERHGVGAALTKSLKRAGTLYLLTVSLTLSFPLVSWLLDAPWAPHLSGGEWVSFVVGVLTLHQTFFLADILLMYTFLVAAAGPVFVLLARGQTRWVIAGSWGLWLLWQIWPEQAAVPWAVEDNTLFHIAAWQVLFITAMVIGYHRQALGRRLAAIPDGVVLAGSGLLLILAALLYFDRLGPLSDHGRLVDFFFAKGDVSAGRLATFATAFAFAYTLVTVAWVPIRRAFGWLLLPLGHHALTAYALHIYVVALFWRGTSELLSDSPRSAAVNALIQLAGVALVWGALVLWPRGAAFVECCGRCARISPVGLQRWWSHGRIEGRPSSGSMAPPHDDPASADCGDTRGGNRVAGCEHPEPHADCA